MNRLGRLFRYYINLDRDKAQEAEVIASISRGIVFRGAHLWTLIFAVIIASVGLNVNSPAAIIGAMLISPLMGPIMGIGLGIGIANFDLVRRGAKNLAVAVLFSIATSTLYFYLSPLHTSTSELLARTNPSVWDVIIAFVGGLAGIIGATRSEKGNVIPGVAIATALMPPLCTVGYGIATKHWYYSIGALYLFFINSVFICIGTVLVVRFMRMQQQHYETQKKKTQVLAYILIIVLLTVAPSIWLGYRIVQKTIFESSADRFLRREMSFSHTQIIHKNFDFTHDPHRIEVLLIGETLDSLKIDSLNRILPRYGLIETKLIVRQGWDEQRDLNIEEIREAFLDEALRAEANLNSEHQHHREASLPDLRPELKELFPKIESYSLSESVIEATDSTRRQDHVLMFIGTSQTPLPDSEQTKIHGWLQARFHSEKVKTLFTEKHEFDTCSNISR